MCSLSITVQSKWQIKLFFGVFCRSDLMDNSRQAWSAVKNIDGGFDKMKGEDVQVPLLMEDLIQGQTNNKTSHRLNRLITMTSNDSVPTRRLRLTLYSKRKAAQQFPLNILQ